METVNSRGTPASNHVHVAVNVFGPGLHPKDVNVAVRSRHVFAPDGNAVDSKVNPTV